MGENDAGIAAGGQSGRDARHDFQRHSRRRQSFRFFRQSSRTRPDRLSFEPNHRLAGASQFDQPAIDVGLRHDPIASSGQLRQTAVPSEGLKLGAGSGMNEDSRIDEIVVQHHVGAAEALDAPPGDQPRIARPGADEINFFRSGLVLAVRMLRQLPSPRLRRKRGLRDGIADYVKTVPLGNVGRNLVAANTLAKLR